MKPPYIPWILIVMYYGATCRWYPDQILQFCIAMFVFSLFLCLFRDRVEVHKDREISRRLFEKMR